MKTEAEIMMELRVKASEDGMRLWRNNSGAFETSDGRYVRFGLGNDSKKLNDAIKSSDLIGIKPIVITEEHVGMTIGQFCCREVKSGNWIYRNTQREKAQRAFIDLVNSMGGDASFYNGELYK